MSVPAEAFQCTVSPVPMSRHTTAQNATAPADAAPTAEADGRRRSAAKARPAVSRNAVNPSACADPREKRRPTAKHEMKKNRRTLHVLPCLLHTPGKIVPAAPT